MKNIYSYGILAFLALLLTIGPSGCSKTTLAPGGAYSDVTVYQADKTINSAYDIMHDFVAWERKHRAVLAAYPDIGKSAQHIRDNARSYQESAQAMLDAYKKDPSAGNKSALQTSLTMLQAALVESQKYLSVPVNSPP